MYLALQKRLRLSDQVKTLQRHEALKCSVVVSKLRNIMKYEFAYMYMVTGEINLPY